MERLKKLIKWIATDGLLHILVCYSMMLTLTPMIGIWLGLLMVMMASVIKEVYDYFVQKDNNREQVIHDMVCDMIGMVAAIIALLFCSITG